MEGLLGGEPDLWLRDGANRMKSWPHTGWGCGGRHSASFSVCPPLSAAILLSFDNFTPNETNPEYRDCTVTFDVLSHIDQWTMDNYQLRPIKIVGFIDGILNETKLSGIGKFHFMGCNELILNEDIAGYTLMYRAVHDVDGDDKITSEQAEIYNA